MWARDASTSFLLPAGRRCAALIEAAGFVERAWDDVTVETAGRPRRRASRAHSVQRLVMGDALEDITAAGHRNRTEGRLVSVQAVFERT